MRRGKNVIIFPPLPFVFGVPLFPLPPYFCELPGERAEWPGPSAGASSEEMGNKPKREEDVTPPAPSFL